MANRKNGLTTVLRGEKHGRTELATIREKCLLLRLLQNEPNRRDSNKRMRRSALMTFIKLSENANRLTIAYELSHEGSQEELAAAYKLVPFGGGTAAQKASIKAILTSAYSDRCKLRN